MVKVCYSKAYMLDLSCKNSAFMTVLCWKDQLPILHAARGTDSNSKACIVFYVGGCLYSKCEPHLSWVTVWWVWMRPSKMGWKMRIAWRGKLSPALWCCAECCLVVYGQGSPKSCESPLEGAKPKTVFIDA